MGSPIVKTLPRGRVTASARLGVMGKILERIYMEQGQQTQQALSNQELSMSTSSPLPMPQTIYYPIDNTPPPGRLTYEQALDLRNKNNW